MSDAQLREAVKQAKAGDKATAIKLTKQYLRANKRDERGWLLLARLSDDETIQRKSVEQVLKIDPSNQKAADMLAELDAATQDDLFVFDDEPITTPFGNTSVPDQFTENTFADTPSVSDESVFEFDDAPQFGTSSGKSDTGMPVSRSTQRQSHSSSGLNMVDVMITVLGVVIVILIITGGAYYMYSEQNSGLFGLFGPDLSKSANTGTVRMHYPENWDGGVSDEGIFAMSEGSESMAADLESAFNGIDFASFDFFGPVNDMETVEFVALVEVTPEVLNQLSSETGISYPSASSYIEGEYSAIGDFSFEGIDINSGTSEITIDGEDGVTGYASIELTDPQRGFVVYFAAATHEGTEYLFVYMAVAEELPNYERLVNRILRTVEFVG